MEIPNDFYEVSKDEFYNRLSADERDITPRFHDAETVSWRVKSSDEKWGWSYPGWKNPGATPKRYAIKKDIRQS